ncbi:ABC transporter ATP-binding protein/permease [Streptomyces sp. S07_1.15]|uniref:ABC transporter ATP-binding protein n=1 Tax=Streptomyces sp. S07_1.15 TaxID=2873925 RepID=UPI001D149A50|nr:ABC transporter ATP-binding protein [Streptomyces sp. S07_1.15]MCC3650696.1 ABC transporter ATP-binding protein/permease [Streptomyces sp. S07_1.15]
MTSLRRCAPYLRPHRWLMAGACGAAFGSMLAGLAMPLVLQRLVDGPVVERDLAALPWFIGGFALLGVVEAVLLGARRLLVVRPATRLETAMRADVSAHIQRLPLSFHSRWQSGQLRSRTVSDVMEIGRFAAFSAIYLMVNVAALAVGLGVLAWLAPVLALIVFLAYVPMVVATTVFEQRFRVVARSAQEVGGDLSTTVEESVLGVRVLKVFGRGPEAVRQFTGRARRLRDLELRKLSYTAALWWIITALPDLAIVAMIGYGGHSVATGALTLGTLMAAVTVATYLRWPADTLGWLTADASTAATAADRYWQVRDEPVTVTDPERPRPLPSPVRGEIRLEGVHYAHPGGRTATLRGVDLTVRAGTTVAVAGATGSGKSTLLSLLSRLDDPTSGRITLDGVDLRDLALADLRSVVSGAFDDPVLFSGTVRANVTLGLPETGDAAAGEDGDAAVWEALRTVRADAFVSALPDKLSTVIGEEGLGLSGGQRQRLALARAILRRPTVLVLDDALSALDVRTEREVETALRGVLCRVTTFVAAHRPGTLRLADQVVFLSGGRVAATGTHDELMAREPEYRLLVAPSLPTVIARPEDDSDDILDDITADGMAGRGRTR